MSLPSRANAVSSSPAAAAAGPFDLLSVHVPKTAGTWFRHCLEQWYGTSLLLGYGGVVGREPGHEHVPLPEPGQGRRVLHGHVLATEHEARERITWLREPAARIASHYFYWLATEPGDVADPTHRLLWEERMSLLEFSELEPIVDQQATWLDGLGIDDFAFVGVTEHMRAEVARLAELLGTSLPYLEPTNATSSEAYAAFRAAPDRERQLAEVRARQSLDLELYDEAVARMHEAWRAQRTRPMRVVVTSRAALDRFSEDPEASLEAQVVVDVMATHLPGAAPAEWDEALGLWFDGLVAPATELDAPRAAERPGARVVDLALDHAGSGWHEVPDGLRAVRRVAWLRDPAWRVVELHARWRASEPRAGAHPAHLQLHEHDLDLAAFAALDGVRDAGLAALGELELADHDVVAVSDAGLDELQRVAWELGLPPLDGTEPPVPPGVGELPEHVLEAIRRTCAAEHAAWREACERAHEWWRAHGDVVRGAA